MAKRTTRPDDDDVLLDVWSNLMPLFVSKRDGFFKVMASHGLTPPHGMALTMLIDGPLRMRDIADRMVCDASYVTAIVDRLEEGGFAVRQPSLTDRRAKEIALTDSGRAAARAIEREMNAPPGALRQLSAADRTALAAILAKLEPTGVVSIWPKTAFHVHDR